MVDINTTPLIDVLLVLLVMLIITIPVQLHAVDLALGAAAQQPVAIAPQQVRIEIGADSVVLWQGEPVTPDELDRRMALAVRQPVPPEVHVRPDARSGYSAFAMVLSATKRHGIERVAVIGSEQFAR